MTRSSSLLAAALLGLGSVAGAQKLTDAPALADYYRRGGTAVTVIGNYVYLDGGELSQVVDGKPPSNQSYISNMMNSTISIDLSKSWTTSSASLHLIPRPWPSKSNQAIWTDPSAGVFYAWGGKWIRGVNMSENALMKFTPDNRGGGAWAEEPPANPDLFKSLHQSEWGAYANTADTGFLIGGLASGWTEYRRAQTQVLPGMVAFNMKSKTWHNGTAGFSPFDTLNGAAAHFVPNMGPNGLVMVFGGVELPVVGANPDWESAPAFDLRNLTFFDPATNKKYWQVTTGSVPPTPRIQTCVAGFRNQEGGYEIILTGGNNRRDKIVYDDTYILSLPGFVWTRVADSPAGKRMSASCVAVGKRQMLSVGGTRTDWTNRDPAPQGLLLFDMTEMKWKDEYDANAAEYQRSEDIGRWYKNGSLDNVSWSSDGVRQLFLTTTNPPTSTSTTDPVTNTTTPSTTSSSTPTAAIAGGVIGGLAFLALLGFSLWFFLRRRRRTSPSRQGTPLPTDEPEAEQTQSTRGYYGSEVSKNGGELPGSKVVPLELNSSRDHAELGGSPTYVGVPPGYEGVGRGGWEGAVEMDATQVVGRR